MNGSIAVRIGIVGSGRIASAYCDAAETSAAVRISAVTDIDEVAASRLAERSGAVPYPGPVAMIESGKVDALLVSTPPVTHAGIALEAIEYGIPVLCEKPFALTPAEALTMVDAARRRAVPLTMASKYRYVPDVARAAELVKAGLIGDVIEADICFAGRVDMSARWNSKREVSGGGVLIDNGAHAVDLIRYFLGPIRSVLVAATSQEGNGAVEDNAVLVAKTQESTLATVRLSWAYDSLESAFMTLHGTGGSLRLGWSESSYRGETSPNWLVFGHGYDKVVALRGQLEDFASAVADGTRLRICDEDALASVAVIDAGYQALRTKTWADVEQLIPWTAEPEQLQVAEVALQNVS
jgi:predicted dehydrogenase